MNAKDINQTFDLVEEVGRYVQLHKSGAYFIGACPMCGGKDRFNIKRNGGDWWICRQCSSDRYHSPIDFVMAHRGLGFKDALEQMGGTLERAPVSQPRQQAVERFIQIAPSPEWQERAWKIVDEASEFLLTDEGAEEGRRYLVKRGISMGAVYMNLLGYNPSQYGRRAIVIPHIDGDTLTAIKYRYLDGPNRFGFEKGSNPHLFGLQHRLESDTTLLFVEGELNAISVLQMLPSGVTVVSSGSKSVGDETLFLLGKLASGYQRVVIWMDEPQDAKRARDGIGRDARLLQSLKIHGVKWDANQYLQNGLLAEFLTKKLSVECMGMEVR